MAIRQNPQASNPPAAVESEAEGEVGKGTSEQAPAGALAVANKLRPVLLRLNRSLRGEAHEMGVTSTQASLLGAIYRSGGIGLGELAAKERMGAPTLVAHIDKLENAGLVERARNDPNDRRRVDLSLTPLGLQVVRTITERRTAWLAARLAALTSDELAAVEAAIGPLEKLAKPAEEERRP